MDIGEFLRWIGILVNVLVAVQEFVDHVPYYGRIAIDCCTHYCYQSSLGLVMWQLTLWIMFLALGSWRRSLDSLPRRAVSCMFLFAFLSGLLGAALAHIAQDFWFN